MILNMGRCIRKQHKIFDSIIVFYLVDMMYNFSFFKKPSKMFFHSDYVSSNVPSFIGSWMRRSIAGSSIPIFVFSATPINVSFSRLKTCASRRFSFFIKIWIAMISTILSCFDLVGLNIERFTTSLTEKISAFFSMWFFPLPVFSNINFMSFCKWHNKTISYIHHKSRRIF